VSFEPVAEMAARLREAAADDPDWLVMQNALGEAEGVAEIHAMQGAMSSLLPASEFGRRWSPKLRRTHPEQITIRRLDAVFDEAVAGIDRPRVYLKLDTQGFDLRAFAGAGSRIEDVLGMQSEVACVPIYDDMPRLTEQIRVYEDAGFELTGMFPVNVEGSSLRVIEFDAVMVRPDARKAR
jgi:FkbM family methyltransferase